MNEILTSMQNPRIKMALKLHRARGRKQQQRIIIFGQREIERAISSGVKLDELFVSEDQARLVQDWPANARFSCHQDIMEKLQYGDRGDGVVATARRPVTALAQFAPRVSGEGVDGQSTPPGRLVLVLEAVEKPGNVGAIIRSLDAVAGSGLLMADPLTDVFHPNSIRSSTGTVFGMPIATGSSPEIQHWLQEHGFTVLTACLQDSVNLYQFDLRGDLAIVLGNEAQGLSNAWRSPRYRAVKLPMLGVADSLNVSATASIMLFEALRQRSLPV